jgi:hypothetical protein
MSPRQKISSLVLCVWVAQKEVIGTMMDARKGDPYCLTWQELLSFEYLAIPAAGIHSLGRTLISANILAFDLIGKADHIEIKKFVLEI